MVKEKEVQRILQHINYVTALIIKGAYWSSEELVKELDRLATDL